MSILKKKKETELVEGETKKKKGIRWFGRFLKHRKKLKGGGRGYCNSRTGIGRV